MGSLPQINTAVIDRTSAVSKIAEYLQDECSALINADTVRILCTQEVDGEEFFNLTNEVLLANFPSITFGQRKRIMKIVQAHDEQNHVETLKSPADTSDEDLGCVFIDVAAGTSEVGSLPVLASYKIRKRSNQERPSNDSKKKKKEVDPESVKPIDVLSILKQKKTGRDVIEYIRMEKCLKKSYQETMMKILYDSVTADQDSPYKYYPDRPLKLALAKGIVTAFPELRDDGDCPWKTWLKKVTTKFETVQAKLPPEKKKNHCLISKTSEKKVLGTNSETNSRSSTAGEPTALSNSVADNLVNRTTTWMNNAIPNPQNRKEISLGLEITFQIRDIWMKNERPTCTEILERYKHLGSYDGDMISEEFGRKEILAEKLCPRFGKVAPFIWKLFEKLKPPAITEVMNQFEDVNLRALVVLPKLLPAHLASRSTNPQILGHIKAFKNILEKIPSSALLQIAPAGLDPESYISSEYSEEELMPIYPFVLWSTNDMKSGNLYLKIDRRTIHIASYNKTTSPENPVVKAVCVAIMAAHVFNLDYHPYLRHVFNYLELLKCVNHAPAASVSSFASAIRELQKP